jgi:hypothetical protein
MNNLRDNSLHFEKGGQESSIERHNNFREENAVNRAIIEPEPVVIDPHYSPQFFAELWGMSSSTVVRWFQDMNGVLKLNIPARNGKRTRIELRIPYSVAMCEYRRRTTQR